MNHRALQRALIVAQYDPDVRFEDLAGRGEAATLGPEELAELAKVDRRGLRTDPLRRRRLLRTLAEEYKASTTLLLAETRSLADMEAFFTSIAFRVAVLHDASLALAFGAFLGVAAQAPRGPLGAGVDHRVMRGQDAHRAREALDRGLDPGELAGGNRAFLPAPGLNAREREHQELVIQIGRAHV